MVVVIVSSEVLLTDETSHQNGASQAAGLLKWMKTIQDVGYM